MIKYRVSEVPVNGHLNNPALNFPQILPRRRIVFYEILSSVNDNLQQLQRLHPAIEQKLRIARLFCSIGHEH
jgi:hypothetical protein